LIISIIIPTYNEINYIDELINSLLKNNIKDSEILFADGGSTDGTQEVIKKYCAKYPFIKLIENEKQFVNFGFNKAFKQSTGKYVTLMGAHAKYPPDFFVNAIKYLVADECDAVGGPLIQSGTTSKGKAIAYCLSSKFGVGNTEFRVYKDKRYVDSVAFAVYKREVFEKAGLLDEDLIKNHDDEFHYRLNKFGFRILMVPEMQCEYFVRNSFAGLFKQYYNYGLYKPLVFAKLKTGIRLRHLIPPLFALYVLFLPLAIIFPFYLIPVAFYLIGDFYFSFINSNSFKIKIFSFLAFPIIHFSYGLGFLFGLGKLS
jgi:glycosyltransferase involved in cell wall biosynthesis